MEAFLDKLLSLHTSSSKSVLVSVPFRMTTVNLLLLQWNQFLGKNPSFKTQ